MRHLMRLVAICSLSLPAAAKPMNVLLVVIDDLGWSDVGCYGSDFYRTPHLDALAADGVLFTQAYANGPNCAPSRAALHTGQYAPRHGVYTVGSSARGRPARRAIIPVRNRTALRRSATTLASVLGRHGYATAHLGKWHLGRDPTRHGFDVNVGGNATGHPKSYHTPYENADLPGGAPGEYLTDRLTAEAIDFMGRHVDRPFFLHLSFYAVHTPIQARADLRARYADQADGSPGRHAAYAAMIEAVDRGIGRVLGAIRVPLVVRWPGITRAGARCDEPVIGTDIMPTVLDLCGVALDTDAVLDGVSLRPLLAGGSIAERALFWHFPCYLERTSRGQGAWRTTPVGAIRRGRYKLIEFFEDGRLEVFDLRDDPGETHDLAAARPDLTAALHAELRAWRSDLAAPVPTEPNPEYRPDHDSK
ncbi:MAG: sulfatase [Planctomycetota bacterium]|jgi:arylsulfatase A-like enzyme